MTLKKCTLRQLDDTFWRVDWEGPAAEARTANCTLIAIAPSIAERDGESWFFCGIWSQSLEEVLARFDLTTEDPSPETAEERARRELAVCDAEGTEQLLDTTASDLRAILAELDRLRAREARFALGPSADAVLAPVRKLRGEIDHSRRQHDNRARSFASSEGYGRANEHVAQREALAVVVKDMDAAIAEAEKIGRGE